jgi:hypothetical protein
VSAIAGDADPGNSAGWRYSLFCTIRVDPALR